MALTRGADHTREDLLGPCAAGRPIPATDLAIDDGGADGVFSAPVGRVDVGGPQEGEHSRELAVEMPGEALGRRQSGRRVDEPAQAGKQAPSGPSEALLGDRVGIPPIAEREGVGEDGLHAGCPRAPRMVGTERATPAEQMCQAALVQRAGEAAIGRPSVADQHTGEVRAQDRDRIVKATPGADRIHGGLRCRERPQPVQHGTDAPAGFIRTDDGTPPDLSAESRVRGRRYPGRAMQDLSKSSRRDRQPEPVLQQCCDLLQRHAHVFVQQDRKRHGARSELYACRAQGVGGLQRMPALHAVPACDAAPDLNVEPPHDWLDDGQVFLVLGRDASGLNRPTTARARHGKRRGIRLIHPRRNRSPAATSIGGTCPPARSPAATLRAVLRKRGGLSKARAPRRVELLLETLASSLPSIAIACRAGQLLTQAGNLILVALDQLVAFVARRSRALVGHACVMSYPRKLYKPNSLDLLPSPAKQRQTTYVLGTDKNSIVRDKLTEMTHLSETSYGTAIGASAQGHQLPCGSQMVNPMLANVTKQNITRNIYSIGRLAHDLAGGYLATMPDEEAFDHPEIGKYVKKYHTANPEFDVMDRVKMGRYIENMTSVTTMVEAMHGAGSPQAQRIVMLGQAEIAKKIKMAEEVIDGTDDVPGLPLRGKSWQMGAA